MRSLLLLRPEPGLSASADRARAMGLEVIACPLFRIEPLAWQAPEPEAYDGLLITSANALRHGGSELSKLRKIPVHCVGPASAATARGAGFKVETVGDGDVEDLLGRVLLPQRLLHLAGKDHRPIDFPGIDTEIVYRSLAIPDPLLPPISGLGVAVHSPRAGTRLAELASVRDRTVVAAISDAAAEAVGGRWERVAVAQAPNDPSLLALAAMLCHTSPPT